MIPTIENTIPIPHPYRGPSKYPFPYMNVGDSFFIASPRTTVQNAAKTWRLNNDRSIRFVLRSMTENGVEGVRVWRVL